MVTATLLRESAEGQADAPLIFEALPFEPRETYIDILLAGMPQRIITSIELLSPDNKRGGKVRKRIWRKA